jgi:hypothetical protein
VLRSLLKKQKLSKVDEVVEDSNPNVTNKANGATNGGANGGGRRFKFL